MKTLSVGIVLATFAGLMLPAACAQQGSRAVQLEILMEPGTSPQLYARDWAGVFQKMGFTPVFRQGRQGERTIVEDFEVRGRKGVKIIGLLERQGAISFVGQSFILTQEEPLQAWLTKLQANGAKGPPNEHPTWGLNEDQYAEVLKLLGTPVDREVDFSNAMKAVVSLRLPTEFKLKFTQAAAKRAVDKPEFIGDAKPDLSVYSKGTALAVALAHFGLGYRPLENPDGEYIIEVDVGDETSNMYPVGWKNTLPVTKVVPGIAKPIVINLTDVPMDALVQVLAGKMELPAMFSSAALKAEGKDLSRIKFSRTQTLSPFRLMDVLGRAQKIGLSVRTDEAGKSFLWVTTKSDFDAFRKRFR